MPELLFFQKICFWKAQDMIKSSLSKLRKDGIMLFKVFGSKRYIESKTKRGNNKRWKNYWNTNKK